MSRGTLRLWPGAPLLAAAVLTATGASAQPALETRDYRRVDRAIPASPQRFAFELRLGPYVPQIDDEFKGAARPFEQTFGTGKGFYIGAELDWQAARIPYVGTIGPGVSLGYTHRSANATLSATGAPSAEQTYITILPMYVTGVLRVDVLAREVSIPVVPYGKAGVGLGLWTTSNDSGTSQRDGKLGQGRSLGTHAALGAMLLLDPIDPASARGFDEEVGVNHSYLFFEWMWSSLGNLSKLDKPNELHVGTSGWVVGLALEF